MSATTLPNETLLEAYQAMTPGSARRVMALALVVRLRGRADRPRPTNATASVRLSAHCRRGCSVPARPMIRLASRDSVTAACLVSENSPRLDC